VTGEGLHPSSKAKRIHFSGKNRTVIDGPFTETKELVAGYWIWNVKSMDEAVEWVKRCPNPMMEDSDIDIRPIFTAEDFGEAYTPEVQAQEERIRQGIEENEAARPRLETGRELTIVGLNESYTMESRVKIPEQWNRFAPHIGRVPGQSGSTTYGVCWNMKESCDFDYLCGVEVNDSAPVSPEFTRVSLPARRYAVFTHRGHVSSLPQTIDAVWKKWLPKSGYEPLHAPCFERYTEEFNPETGLGGMEIWVPVNA
ncbi:MAG TPA: GyrI-like domain-containing protein, partial [Pirellulales bacterium]